MATNIYEINNIKLLDGTSISIYPLKIFYLRQFMNAFNNIKECKNDDESIAVLVECTRIAMQQFYPEISNHVSEIEDNMDIHTVYDILEYCAGIRVREESTETVKDQATESNNWDNLDLAKLESEAFLLGIWKDYLELEKSMSMPELMATLSISRELDYQEKKFLAAMQGVNLDEQTGKGQDEWEAMKARVFSGGATSDPNDVLSLQGVNAQKAGFGIGMGLDYEDSRDPSVML